MTPSLVRIGFAGLDRMGRRHAQNLAHRVQRAKLVRPAPRWRTSSRGPAPRLASAGRLAIGRNASLNRVEIGDAHGVRGECTPTFYERFVEAFLGEAQAFVDVVAEDRATTLTLHDATEATRIGIAVTESLRTKRTVELDRVP